MSTSVIAAPPTTRTRAPQAPHWSGGDRAATPAATFASVPADLRSRARWVVWRAVWKALQGKYTKVPYRAAAPREAASSTDPATWDTYDAACVALVADPTLAGLGYVLANGDDVVGVDVDACLEVNGEPNADATAILAALPGTYAERSPSGRGLRIFARGVLPAVGRKRGAVEMYAAERFLTITGQVLPGRPSCLAPLQPGIDTVHARYIGAPGALALPLAPATSGAAAMARPDDLDATDRDVLARAFRARNADETRRLYQGAGGSGDPSADDFALAERLAFYTRDAVQVERLLMASGRRRAKWEEARGGSTWLRQTIGRVLELKAGGVAPSGARSVAGGSMATVTAGAVVAPAATNEDPVVAEFNRDYAIVTVPGGHAIVREIAGHDGRPTVDLMTDAAFLAEQRPRKGDAHRWLASADRRTYSRLVFEPGLSDTRAYNLWRGFAVEPDPRPRPEERCARYLEHLEQIICDGDSTLYRWVLAWLADLVQRPRQRPGTAVIVRGIEGTGKSAAMRPFRRMLGRHCYVATSPGDVVGRFNAHLQDVLLLHADEACFSADLAAIGRLRAMITEDTQTIERKGHERYRVANYLRLFGTTENEFVIPAALNERRFAVIDVSERRVQQHAYFARLWQEIDGEGTAALLAYLLAYDYAGVNLRQIPTTAALLEQKDFSLDPERAWWLDVLRAGELPADRLGQPGLCESQVLFTAYQSHAKATGARRSLSETAWGRVLNKLVPDGGVQRIRASVPRPGGAYDRPWAYRFPPLADCRAHAPGGKRTWDDPHAAWSSAPTREDAR